MSPSMVRESTAGVADEIVEKTARLADHDPLDLPVLYDAVDPDALEQLLEDPDRPVTVEFSYAGFTVVADSEDGVEVRDD